MVAQMLVDHNSLGFFLCICLSLKDVPVCLERMIKSGEKTVEPFKTYKLNNFVYAQSTNVGN